MVRREAGPRGEVTRSFDGASGSWAITTAPDFGHLRLDLALRGATVQTWLHPSEAIALRLAVGMALLGHHDPSQVA